MTDRPSAERLAALEQIERDMNDYVAVAGSWPSPRAFLHAMAEVRALRQERDEARAALAEAEAKALEEAAKKLDDVLRVRGLKLRNMRGAPNEIAEVGGECNGLHETAHALRTMASDRRSGR